MATIDRTRQAQPDRRGRAGSAARSPGHLARGREELSKIKGEPDWMAEKRLKSLEIFERKPIPTWGPDLAA